MSNNHKGKVVRFNEIQYAEQFGACRDLGHAWAYTINWTADERHMVCLRCQTVRREDLRGWRISARSYRYAPGYLVNSQTAKDLVIEVRQRLLRLVKNHQLRWVTREPILKKISVSA